MKKAGQRVYELREECKALLNLLNTLKVSEIQPPLVIQPPGSTAELKSAESDCRSPPANRPSFFQRIYDLFGLLASFSDP